MLPLIIFCFGVLIAACVTPIVIRIYTHFKLVEDPKNAKHIKVTHDHPVPRGGGLVIGLTVLIGSAIFLKFDSYLTSIMIGTGILMILGSLDDIFNLHPIIRLVVGTAVALMVVLSGTYIRYVTNPFGAGVIRLDTFQVSLASIGYSEINLPIVAMLLSVIFILWNMNIVNWSKGSDGQMPGFVAIALLFIGLLSTRFVDDPSQFNTQSLSFLLAGTFVGFLLWNKYPQRIMAGYGAGSLAGFFLATLSILSGTKIATTLMVLAIPTADAIFTIARRILAGKSPFWGDRGHLHHKLLDVLGWGRRRIAYFYWLTTAIMGILSLYLNTLGKIFTILLVTIFVFGFLVWVKVQSTRPTKGKITHR